jgi:hypothetical protein
MDSHPPWILREKAPAWVAAVITEEQWPESAVTHLLKRLLAEGIDCVHFHAHPDGVSTVELASKTSEWPTLATRQPLDATRGRPFDDAIKRALDVISQKRAK